MTIQLKRAYEAPSPGDGKRYLVERLWPRGVVKDSLVLEGWLKDLAPSAELRRWYGHEPKRWPEFVKRYEGELENSEQQAMLATLASEAREGTVTFVLATKDVEHSGAKVLKDVVEELMAKGS